MQDAFSRYEIGLSDLLAKLGSNHPRCTEALTLQARLLENIEQARRYGDTETRRAERAQIVDSLNRLTHENFKISFNDLCKARDVSTFSRIIDRISCILPRVPSWASNTVMLLLGSAGCAIILAVWGQHLGCWYLDLDSDTRAAFLVGMIFASIAALVGSLVFEKIKNSRWQKASLLALGLLAPVFIYLLTISGSEAREHAQANCTPTATATSTPEPVPTETPSPTPDQPCESIVEIASPGDGEEIVAQAQTGSIAYWFEAEGSYHICGDPDDWILVLTTWVESPKCVMAVHHPLNSFHENDWTAQVPVLDTVHAGPKAYRSPLSVTLGAYLVSPDALSELPMSPTCRPALDSFGVSHEVLRDAPSMTRSLLLLELK